MPFPLLYVNFIDKSVICPQTARRIRALQITLIYQIITEMGRGLDSRRLHQFNKPLTINNLPSSFERRPTGDLLIFSYPQFRLLEKCEPHQNIQKNFLL